MTTAYAYRTETNTVVAKILGDDNQSIETKYSEIYGDNTDYGLAYSAAYADGVPDDLTTDGDFEVIDVRK